jgi:hypothetical protein
VLNPKTIANLTWLPALAVGALQMYRVDAGVLTAYGADFFGPIALYASLRVNGTIFRRFMTRPPVPAAAAGIVILGCVAWEWCQRYDFSGTPLLITRGTFDPYDIVAYVAGAALAFITEKLATPKLSGVAALPNGDPQ